MKHAFLAILAIAALPLAAQAGDMSYSYLQAGYNDASVNSGPDSHGWIGQGSAALGQNFQVIGGGSRTFRDGFNAHPDATSNAWNLGAGFHTPVSDRTDFVADASYHQSHVEGVSGELHDSVGEFGVRSELSKPIEGWLMAGYENTPDSNHSNGEVFGKAGAQYKFNKNWGLVGEAKVAQHSQSIFFGPRLSF